MIKSHIVILTLLFTSFIMSGCSLLRQEPVERVVTKEVLVQKIPLDLKSPDKFVWMDVEYIIITPENYEEKLSELQEDGKSVALYTLDTDSYEALSINIANVLKYMKEQKLILAKYKEYYETELDSEK
jgi:ABC-type Zn uptake system ZnuABC Zn-binding protein ZnuA